MRIPSIYRYAFLLLMLLASMPGAVAQRQERKVTPVEKEDGKPEKPQLHYYDIHGNKLANPVYIVAEADTVDRPGARPVYPALTSASFGFNFMDAVMMLAGQKYSSFDVWGNLSIHNWFFPTVEIGIGRASRTPERNNYTYRTSPSLYVKAGIDYNFLYKSSPDYNVFVGVRAGFSSFRYSIDNVSITSGYWDQTQGFSIADQKSTAFYGEVLAGLKVKIFKRLSMGWSLRYHFRMHISDASHSSPWFIPGFGQKNAPFSATFSLIYTLPIHNRPSTDIKQ